MEPAAGGAALAIGLDVNVAGTGAISVPLSSRLLLHGAALRGDPDLPAPRQPLDPIGATGHDVRIRDVPQGHCGDLQPGQTLGVTPTVLPTRPRTSSRSWTTPTWCSTSTLTATSVATRGRRVPQHRAAARPGGQLRLPLPGVPRDLPSSAIFSTGQPHPARGGQPASTRRRPGHAVLFT